MLLAFLRTFCPVTQPAPRDLPVYGQPAWRIRRFRDRAAILAGWPPARRADDFWLRASTLEFLTETNQGFTTEALLVYQPGTAHRLLLTVQTFYFNPAGQVSDGAGTARSRWQLRRALLSPFSFKTLVVGQLLTSGDYDREGMAGCPPEELRRLLPAVAETLCRERRGYAAVLLKDLPTEPPANRQLVEDLQSDGFTALPTDPVMQLPLDPAWRNLDDYLAAVTSKYRVRYRRARTHLRELQTRELGQREVLERLDRIYELFVRTSAGADFNVTQLRRSYFAWLAGVGTYRGYFDAAGRLIGFTTTVANGPVLHAHYLGMEEAYKFSHHLYHNMLYDLLETAIAGGFRTLDYGRTALEIKSSLGAVGHDFPNLLRARSSLINRLVPYFVPAVFDARPWQPRSPFRRV